MFKFFFLENIFNNGSKESLLIIISILSIIFGVLVIISKNPVRSVLFLIGLFLTIALYLFTLNLSFIALAYLLVYVGAVSILFLFILMLINVRVSELSTDNNNSIPLSIIITAIFSIAFSDKYMFTANGVNLALLFNIDLNDTTEKTELFFANDTYEYLVTNLFFVKDTNSFEKVFLVFSCMWDNIIGEVSHITSLGNILYTTHSLPIIIIGLILLLSMIGAISVTAKSVRDGK